MSLAIAAAFDATLRDVLSKGPMTHDDLIRLNRSGQAPTNALGPLSLDQVKYFADFASNPATANAHYKHEREEAELTHGQKHVLQILRSNKHHKWRKHGRYDFPLSETETAQLAPKSMLFTLPFCG